MSAKKLFSAGEEPMEFRKLCNYYKGERECPFEAGKGNAGKFWMAEQFVCEEYARTVQKQVETDFYRMVAAYISKWAPYNYIELINDYLSQSGVDDKIKEQVKFLYR